MFQIAAVGRALCDELRSASVRVVCGQPVTTSVFAPLFRSKPSSHESVLESLAWSVRHSPSRVAAGLSGGFRLARYGLFGLRGDAAVVDADHGENESRSRRRRSRCCGLWEEHKGNGVAPEGICQACRRRSLRRSQLVGRGAACSGQWAQRVGDQLVAEPDVWLQHRPQRTTRRTADGSRTAQIASLSVIVREESLALLLVCV